MGVATGLDEDVRPGRRRQVVGHDRGCAAIEREGRGRHPGVPERDQLGQSIGFLAELMTALHGREEDTYSVAERVGGEANWQTLGERSMRRLPANLPSAARQESPAGPPHIKPLRPSETSRDVP